MVNKIQKIGSNHPYLVIEEIIGRYGSQIKFEFGLYLYSRNTLEDQREYIFLKAKQMTKDDIENLIRSLKPDCELALHSRVYSETNEVLHIPMIDFLGSPSADDWRRVREALPQEIGQRLRIFDSGSSYHAYSTTLISA